MRTVKIKFVVHREKGNPKIRWLLESEVEAGSILPQPIYRTGDSSARPSNSRKRRPKTLFSFFITNKTKGTTRYTPLLI